jgi:excinuclease ABC subunit A
VEQKREGDLEITEVGRDAQMPWQIDGRRWHTHDRVGRSGQPCKWDGRILARVVDRIHELGTFSETDWNARSVVEIAAAKKSDGWFFHAITGETWLLKMKFRVYRGAFKHDELVRRLPLRTLNQLEELPIYSNEPRVNVKSLRGPWQEVQINAFTLEEIDQAEFWTFLEQAVESFTKFTDRVAEKPEDLMPWKKLGQKWHFLRKGFPPGKRILWEVDVLEQLCQLLSDAAPGSQFLWNNQQVVHLFVAGQRDAWASIYTKRPQSLILTLSSPKGRIALGRIAELGRDRELDATRPDRDVVKFKFRTTDDLRRGDFAQFLRQHLESLGSIGTAEQAR